MKIRLHRKLYDVESIEEALEAFKEFGTFSTEIQGEYTVITVTEPDPDFEAVLPHEIANFVLAGTIERAKAA